MDLKQKKDLYLVRENNKDDSLYEGDTDVALVASYTATGFLLELDIASSKMLS